MIIRWLLKEGPMGEFQGIAALEIDGVRYEREAVEQIIAAYHAARAPNVSVRPAHRVSRVFCKVPGCGEKRTGKSRYCKKHDMRFKRHGNPLVVLRAWDKKKGKVNEH